ncbi:hypothetical protein PR202_gb21091 [Eleusine coracana subsp. coracana]|uniref:Uncharacterized protein n=1 Tax=Eleusine coracana subsp. coracana TaxID=191504 RepID=A0AAV5FCD1_ELECO|nr:hypothetical protein PR202_gb21091 [Eleusine coracana subsp. coracana]
MATNARHRVSSFLAVGVLLVSLLAPPGAALQPGWFCGNSGNCAAGSSYAANLRQLSSTLPSKASGPLFATANIGAAPDVAYGLALCRGDSSPSTCDSCITIAFGEAMQQCPYSKDATVVLDECNLRFSDINFLPTIDNGPIVIANDSLSSVSSSVEEFDAAVGVLLNVTADYAAANSSRRFATGEEATRDSSFTIYGLAQCTPDMSPADCQSCLQDLLALRQQYLSGRQSGRISGVRCNFRYDLNNKFFTGGPTLRLQTQLWPPAAPNKNYTETPSPGGRRRANKRIALAITLSVGAAMLAIITFIWLCFWRKRNPARKHVPFYAADTDEDTECANSLLLDIATLRAATDNFVETSEIGQGGFGAVYKGVLPDGQEIAVKRLFQSSEQGIQELKNELVLVAKLQHKNLIRLIGVCLQEHEKLLVYEYMPNRSIDTILFDPEKSKELNWGRRFKIITGIARGLRYLHEDSQFKIIHRDLKASNVLLDSDYSPKISDFGLAKLFGGNQDQSLVTKSVIGTYGYMAPEYAMHGHYSVKSDVFSFGVLVLEILTGRRSSGSYNLEESVDLLSLVWEHWSTDTIMEIMDSSLRGNTPGDLLLKCVHIGLLCTQDNPVDRPMMSTVNVMLSSNTVSLQAPLKPVFFIPSSSTYSNVYSESYLQLP